MKNKLGILGALVLSLTIAGSAFAQQDTTQTTSTPGAGMQKTSMGKKTNHKKHHRSYRKSHKKTSMNKPMKMKSTGKKS